MREGSMLFCRQARRTEGIDRPQKEAQKRGPKTTENVGDGADNYVRGGVVLNAEAGKIKNDDDHRTVGHWLRHDPGVRDDEAHGCAEESGGN